MHRTVDSTIVLLFLNVPGKIWDQMFWKKRLVYRRHGCGVHINPLSAWAAGRRLGCIIGCRDFDINILYFLQNLAVK
jgi:hypothetical protein